MKIATLFCMTAACFLWTASYCQAADATYILNADGIQSIPGGDLDGTAFGSISLDDVTGLVSWSFSYSNIDSPSAMHIHGSGGSAGFTAPVIIGLGVGTSGGSETLVDSLVHAPLSDITSILSNPTDFYINIHNTPFGSGAVRGQLGTLVPEPSSLLLLISGLGYVALSRKRKASIIS